MNPGKPDEAGRSWINCNVATTARRQGRACALEWPQFSAAYALAGLFETEILFQAALVTGVLPVDAARGSDAPFDPLGPQGAPLSWPGGSR